MSLELFAFCAAVGTIGGFIAGLLGVGGGLVVVPSLAFVLPLMGVAEHRVMHLAVGTSLATIVCTASSSAYKHYRQGNVDLAIAVRLGAGIITGSLAAGLLAGLVPAIALRVAFIAFLSLVSIRMLLGIEPPSSWRLPATPGLVAAGGLIGSLSAWVGVGGGALTVPFLVATKVEVRRAIGTSALLGLPLSIFGAGGFIYSGWSASDLPAHTLGYVYLPVFASIAAFSVVFARLGAAATERVPVEALKRVFAVLLLIGAAKMAFDLM